MDKLARGPSFYDAKEEETMHTKAEMFAEDGENCSNDFSEWAHNPPTAQENSRRLQKDAHAWESVLLMTGGSSKLKKCAFCSMQCKFSEERVPSSSKVSKLPEMWITSGKYKQKVMMPHHDHNKTHETLGC